MVPYQRVALYILFDSIEADLISHVRSAAKDGQFLVDAEREKALARVASHPDAPILGQDDIDLIVALDLGDKFDIVLRHCNELGDLCAYFKSLHANFTKLISVRNDIMHGRPLTMDQQVRALAFAQDLLLNPGVWPRLSKTYREYSNNPAAFIDRSITFLDENLKSSCINNLPVPDFDDTGWLPRASLEQDLKKKLLGRHPVISILGDGGNGKTALALQVLHNLVRTNDHDFDAIVWTSAKSSALTVNGIEEIEGAAIVALDVMNAAAALEPDVGSPLERLTRFLAENKVLMVVDNFESIIGDEIREFAQDVPGEIKLLFTSRHPIGGDLTVFVGELEPSDAFRYFHRLIQVYGLGKIYKSNDNSDFSRWLDRLSYKPLSIKWLVLGIKAGLNGEAISANPDSILKFCLDNVISNLGEEAQAVIFVLATLPVPAPPSVIREVSALSALKVVDGIAELNRFNLVEAKVLDDGSQAFSVRPFARSFIHRLILPKKHITERILENYRVVEGLYQKERGAQKASPYSFRHYDFVNRSQLLISRDLRRAVELAYEQQFEDAEQIVTECKRLDPGYFENHRAEAMIAFAQNDLSRAIESLLVAIKLDRNQAKLYYLIGTYYLRIMESHLARENFDKAIELLPGFFPYREAARNEMICFEFEAAEKYLSGALEIVKQGGGDKIQIVDLELQLFTRKIGFFTSNHKIDECLNEIDGLNKFIHSVEDSWIYDRTVDHLMRVIPSVIIVRKSRPEEAAPLDLLVYLEERFMQPSGTPESEVPARGEHVGTLRQAGLNPTFGFIDVEGEADVFVHISETGFALWNFMINGGSVSFDIIHQVDGRNTARNIRAAL